MNDKYSNTQTQNDDCGCKDVNTAKTKTDESIKKERDKLCLELYSSAGVVAQYEMKVKQLRTLEKDKTCSFIWSEEYYHYYRELSLSYGSKLKQSTDSIKDGINKNSKSSDDLSVALKAIAKSAKDIRTKLAMELVDAANKLRTAANDSCNCTAMAIITGKKPPGCSDTKTPPTDTGKGCPDAENTFKKLIGEPEKLVHDADGLVGSSYNVVSIQGFSSLSGLDSLGHLIEGAKGLTTHILEAIKKGEEAVKKSYDDIGKMAEELSKADVEKYAKRSIFEGLYDSSRNICCNQCECLKNKSCGDEICKICKEILPDPPSPQTNAPAY